MKSNQDYKNSALAALKGNWAAAVVTIIVLFAIMTVLVAPGTVSNMGRANGFQWGTMLYVMEGASFLITVFVLYPLSVGVSNSFRLLYAENDTDLIRNLFRCGFRNWLHIVWGMFLMVLYVFLWSLLFVIPGIVKAYSYAMTPYIIVENPELSANQAIDRSREMMRGRKFDLFYLHLSFIGWGILCLLTFGIGFLWLIPYMDTAQAAFYADVKADREGRLRQ